jgi:pimeloyl-ACP methyl ester carboxylesterase
VGLADFPAFMRRVTVPTLLLYGANDPLHDGFAADAMACLADGRVVQVPATGRFPQQEAPAATAAILAEFLGGLAR